jgi:hypothetical protein
VIWGIFETPAVRYFLIGDNPIPAQKSTQMKNAGFVARVFKTVLAN